jgi:MFS family permease
MSLQAFCCRRIHVSPHLPGSDCPFEVDATSTNDHSFGVSIIRQNTIMADCLRSGMMGQYPFAAIIGKLTDKYGPWACSIIAGCLFFTGFGLFAREIAKVPDDMALPSASSFHHLVVYFFIAGLGSTFSYVAWFSYLCITYHPV